MRLVSAQADLDDAGVRGAGQPQSTEARASGREVFTGEETALRKGGMQMMEKRGM